jgi:hypothetical protein
MIQPVVLTTPPVLSNRQLDSSLQHGAGAARTPTASCSSSGVLVEHRRIGVSWTRTFLKCPPMWDRSADEPRGRRRRDRRGPGPR